MGLNLPHKPLKPINTEHELEFCIIAELDQLSEIGRLAKELANRYLERQYTPCRAIAVLLARHHEELVKCLIRTEECRAKLAREREAPKSQKLDYTRYDERYY